MEKRPSFTKLALSILSEWKDPQGSVGYTIIYPDTGPASGEFHPDHPKNPANN